VVDDVTVLERVAQAPEPESSPPPPESIRLPDELIAGQCTALDVLAGMNDALRAPLVAVRGRAELLQAGLLGQITPDQAQWLHAIHDNTDRAFRLLDAVQYLIMLQRDEVRIDWSNFIASDLLREACHRMQQRADARGHHLIMQVPEPVPMARGDYYQSLIVLTDLLDNAVRYTPPGGQIRLSAESLGTHVLFTVADSGIGLRPEDLEYIGSPFWRGVHHPLVHQHAGTGLSLFLARQVLALQSGELIFSGELGMGSTFSFTLLAPA
jgi:signal transduction histidine kinase